MKLNFLKKLLKENQIKTPTQFFMCRGFFNSYLTESFKALPAANLTLLEALI